MKRVMSFILVCMIGLSLHASDSKQLYVGRSFSDGDIPSLQTKNAVFINCDFSKNVRKDYKLESLDFSGSYLIGCNFSGKNLSGAKFSDAVITSTSDTSPAVQAYIRQAGVQVLPGLITTFAQAKLDNAQFTGATVSSSFVGASLNSTKFNNAQLSQCSFSYADLNGADFSSFAGKTKIVLSSFDCAINIDKALIDAGYQQIKNTGYSTRCEALKPFIMGAQTC